MLIICGKAGTGKSTVAKILEDTFGYDRILGCTTRPMREGEENFVDYVFENEKMWELHNYPPIDFLVETQYPAPNNDGVWKYGTLREDVLLADSKTVLVANPTEVKKIVESNLHPNDRFIVYLYVDKSVERRRMIQHGDNDYVARMERDDKDFRNIERDIDIDINTTNLSAESVAFLINKTYCERMGL